MLRSVPLRKTVLWMGLLLLVAFAVVLFVVRFDRVVVAEGTVRGGVETLRAARAGILQRLLVVPGESVVAGASLAEFVSEEIDLELSASMARSRALEAKQSGALEERARLLEDTHADALGVLETERKRAKLEHEAAVVRVNRMRVLAVDGLVREMELDEVQLALDLAELALGDASVALERKQREQSGDLKRLDVTLEEVAAEIEEEVNQRRILQLQIERSVLSALTDGIVVMDPAEQLLGRAVSAGESVLQVATQVGTHFEGSISDGGRARVQTGTRALVRIDAYPWLLHGAVEGELVFVSDAREAAGGFRVRVDFVGEEKPGPLLEGMGAKARIVLEERVSLGRYLIEFLAGQER